MQKLPGLSPYLHKFKLMNTGVLNNQVFPSAAPFQQQNRHCCHHLLHHSPENDVLINSCILKSRHSLSDAVLSLEKSTVSEEHKELVH